MLYSAISCVWRSKESPVYWYSGALQETPIAPFDLTDRGLTLGDGVFDTCAAHHGRVFLRNAHFERFATALATAWNDGRPDPQRAFETLGRAYLAFARDEPAYYVAMFETHIAFDAHAGLLAASDRSFAILREAAERLTATLPRDRRPPSLMMALHVWSIAHGIASLFVRADPSRRKLPMSPEDLLEAGVLVYLQGLGLAGGSVSGQDK